jgi:NNP family nitrate/nitrite transporter-like MFS transporter
VHGVQPWGLSVANNYESRYKWYVLGLGALTYTCAMAMPRMCMPVLFKEISLDLNLSLVQIGGVWGTEFLSGIITGLAGGLLGDRFGVRRILSIACLLAGGAGALRGLSSGFTSLAATTFLFGFIVAVIPVNVIKTVGIWFSGRHLGLANGITGVGMAIGFMAGSMLSATVLSPLLGGWRWVLLLYGILSALISVLWFFTVREPGQEVSGSSTARLTLSQTFLRVIRLKNVWLIGLALAGHSSCINSMLGYLPLYLRERGWPVAGADGTVATFHGVSMLSTIPLALLSDRFRSRKTVLIPAVIITGASVALLSAAHDQTVWLFVILAGLFRDGFMAIILSMVIEVKGVGADYAGTASALVLAVSRLVSFGGPPVGNSLAGFHPGLPFVFWGALALVAPISLYLVKEQR